MKVSKSFSRKTFRKVGIVLSIYFLSSLFAGVFALVAGECQVTLIDIGLIGVAVRQADWCRA